jgi:hypothetical protein
MRSDYTPRRECAGSKETYVCTAENRDTIRVSTLKPQSPKDAVGEATEELRVTEEVIKDQPAE